MNRILIGRNDEAAKNNKLVLNRLVTYLQTLYDAFSEVQIELTLPELIEFVKSIRYNPAFDVAGFVKEKLIAKEGKVTFGGITLDREKLKDLIQLPDLNLLEKTKQEARDVLTINATGYSIREDLLQMINGIVSKKNDADSVIDAEFTYYTNTEAGAKLAKATLALCDTLNTFIKVSGVNHSTYQYDGIPGISKATNGECIPDINFIKSRDK